MVSEPVLRLVQLVIEVFLGEYPRAQVPLLQASDFLLAQLQPRIEFRHPRNRRVDKSCAWCVRGYIAVL